MDAEGSGEDIRLVGGGRFRWMEQDQVKVLGQLVGWGYC